MRMIIRFEIKIRRKECVGKTNQSVEKKNNFRKDKTKQKNKGERFDNE